MAGKYNIATMKKIRLLLDKTSKEFFKIKKKDNITTRNALKR